MNRQEVYDRVNAFCEMTKEARPAITKLKWWLAPLRKKRLEVVKEYHKGKRVMRKEVERAYGKMDKIVDESRKRIDEHVKDLKKTILVGLGVAGGAAGLTTAAASPYALRVHRKLMEVEKATKIPLAGEVPETK